MLGWSRTSAGSAEVVERLVDDREADDGVNDIGVDAPTKPDARQHRGRMPDSEDADVDADILHLVEKEDDAEQEQDVVVARHHVFGAEIHEGDDVHPPDLLDITRISGRDVVGQGMASAQSEQGNRDERQDRDPAHAGIGPAPMDCVHGLNSAYVFDGRGARARGARSIMRAEVGRSGICAGGFAEAELNRHAAL